MVKIAIAGGSGKVASEIVKALAATQKHSILILSRKDIYATEATAGVAFVKIDYSDKEQLGNVLQGVHTVLSFVGGPQDPGSIIQKNLIDAAIAAGVKRFAPSEWSSSSIDELPWYAEKGVIREYLADINKAEKVIEYSLFQPGLFVDFFAPPGTDALQSSQELWIDFKNCRAITLEGKDDEFTLTTAKDLANIVVRAVEYPGEWPVIGGVHGTTLSSSKLLEIGARVLKGQKLDITTLKEEDVRADDIKSPWIPKFEDPSLTPEQSAYFSKLILKGSLLSGLSRSWVVSDEWNRLLPDYQFTDAESFLVDHWAEKA